MNWPKVEPTEPKEGFYRCRQFFCWTPTKIGNRVYWLESVIVKQVYHVMQCEGDFHGWYNESIWGEKP